MGFIIMSRDSTAGVHIVNVLCTSTFYNNFMITSSIVKITGLMWRWFSLSMYRLQKPRNRPVDVKSF